MTLLQQNQRRVENGRLVYYRQKADDQFWDEHWANSDYDAMYAAAETEGLIIPVWKEKFPKYLPKDGLIIEAGSGIGQVVLALRNLGYQIEGVEYAEKTVDFAKSHYPDLSVRVGDVTKLDVPEGHYAGYISIGVVEHRQEGPEPFLDEAYRILRPNGIALISVPYFNPVRRLKGQLGLYRGQKEGLEFYQYAFSKAEFAGYLQKAGFEVLEIFEYAGTKGFKDEMKPFNILLNASLTSKRLRYRLEYLDPYRRKFAHMMMAACRKAEK